jgi:hypothetical protein
MLPTLCALRVVKRDGSEEPFNTRKLTQSLAAALAEAGDDVAAAPLLAEALAWHLHAEGGDQVRSDELAYRLQRVLEQVGRPAAAICFAREAAQRASSRRRLRVLPAEGAPPLPQPWDRRRWVQHICRLGLTGEQARRLVNRVERHLLRLGLNPVSEILVRELVACERQSGPGGEA